LASTSARLSSSIPNLVEQGRHGPGTEVTLDIGPASITLDPAELLG
jgi:hypothetical protein